MRVTDRQTENRSG